MKCLLTLVLLVLSQAVIAEDRLSIYTVNYPLQYFAQRIAGTHADVVFPAPADVDPALWTPDAATIDAYQKADLVLLNGAGYAKWAEKVSLPRLRQVDTSASFAIGYIYIKDNVTHSDGPGEKHSHTGTAFTTWLDFYQAAQQGESIMQALVKKRPQYKAEFQANFKQLRKDLMAMDLEMQRLVAKDPDKPLLASHPVYHYLARRYLLHIEDVHWEPKVMPPEDEWQRLVYATERFPAQWMIWEKPPLPEIGTRLDSLGIDVLVFDPCMNTPQQGDFLAVMTQNLNNLKRAYTE